MANARRGWGRQTVAGFSVCHPPFLQVPLEIPLLETSTHLTLPLELRSPQGSPGNARWQGPEMGGATEEHSNWIAAHLYTRCLSPSFCGTAETAWVCGPTFTALSCMKSKHSNCLG